MAVKDDLLLTLGQANGRRKSTIGLDVPSQSIVSKFRLKYGQRLYLFDWRLSIE